MIETSELDVLPKMVFQRFKENTLNRKVRKPAELIMCSETAGCDKKFTK